MTSSQLWDRTEIASLDAFKGKIRPINLETDSGKLATFFNEIDDLWPGSFTQGLKYDAPRAREFVEKRSALETLVAFDQERLVGFCSVHKRMEEPGVSYIGILGAHPDVLGQKYGKHLLLAAVEFAVENGHQRQDLHTWPSNMKAVPLYKKIGLQWVPDTNVYMQNYVPSILQNAFCKPFFEKHPQWYLNQVREIHQAPDDTTYGNDLKGFVYRFEEGNDVLEVIVDRYSRSIAGITREIDGKKISCILQQNRHEVFTGTAENLSLNITNEEMSSDLQIAVSFEGSKEVQITSLQETIVVPPGKTVTLEKTYTINDSTLDSNINRKTPSIKGKLMINGLAFTLEAGMRARQQVEISMAETSWWIPTGDQDIHLKLQNRATKASTGNLILWTNSNVEITPSVIPITLAPEENAGVSFQISTPPITDPTSSITLYCQARLEECSSRVYEIPLFLADKPMLAASLVQDRKQVILQNQYVRCIINLEGATLKLRSTDLTSMGIGLGTFDYGPPFGFSEFDQKEFSCKMIDQTHSKLVRLTKKSQTNPNLVFHRIFELSPGETHVCCWEEIENLDLTEDSVTILIHPNFIEGIQLPLGLTYLVFDGTGVSGPNFYWPAGRGDLPEGTDRYEPWIFIRSGENGFYHIFETPNVLADPSRSKLVTLEKKISIPPLKSSVGPRSWLGCGRGIDVEEIRSLAYYLVKQERISLLEGIFTTKPFLALEIPADQLVIGEKEVKIDLTLSSTRSLPLDGQLTVKLPSGWEAASTQFAIKSLNLLNPHSVELILKIPSEVTDGIYNLEFEITTPFFQRTEKRSFIIFDGKNPPEITDLPVIEKKERVSVKNNSLEVISSKDFGACVTQLNYKGVPLLISNFPTVSPSIIFTRDPAGIVTFLQTSEDNLSDMKNLDETYTSRPKISDHWSGVEYSVKIHELKSLKGLVMNIGYELLGGDLGLLRVRTVIQNRSSTYFQFLCFSLITVGLAGKPETLMVTLPMGNTPPFHFSRENPIPIIGTGSSDLPYLTFEIEGHKLTIIPTSSFSKIFPVDAGKMWSAGGIATFWSLAPGQTQEVSFFLVVDAQRDQHLEEIKRIFS
ncbi:MAG: GNAT family N-acetyltransferase [Candidatus Heimdallarchaeota archaeon]